MHISLAAASHWYWTRELLELRTAALIASHLGGRRRHRFLGSVPKLWKQTPWMCVYRRLGNLFHNPSAASHALYIWAHSGVENR